MNKAVKITFVATVAIWGLLSAAANFLAYGDGYNSVAFAFSMRGAEGAPAMWRAISNPALIHLGLAAIWGSKLAAGVLCSIGTVQMWRARRGTPSHFDASKTFGLLGISVFMLMLFFGFIVISGTYFELWRDVKVMGFEAHVYAFGYFMCLGILGLFVAQPEPREFGAGS